MPGYLARKLPLLLWDQNLSKLLDELLLGLALSILCGKIHWFLLLWCCLYALSSLQPVLVAPAFLALHRASVHARRDVYSAPSWNNIDKARDALLIV